MEISKKNPKRVDPMRKIWPNLATEDNINEVPLHVPDLFLLGMVEIE